MKKNLRRHLIFVFLTVFICGVGAYFASLDSSDMVCYCIKEPGVIKDGNSLIPIARFDRLKLIAKIGKDKKIEAPYYMLCERIAHNGKSDLEELMLIPYKKDKTYRTLSYVDNLHFKKCKSIKKVVEMPDCIKDESLTFRRAPNLKKCSVVVTANIGYLYAYGHPNEEMHVSNEYLQHSMAELDSSSNFSIASHGVALMQKRLTMEEIKKIKNDTSQVEGDEYFCRTWLLKADGSFQIPFFVRELGVLKNVVYGKVEGRYDSKNNVIVDERIAYEPNDRDFEVTVALDGAENGGNAFIGLKVRHGMLTHYEKFPVSMFLRRMF